MMLQKKSQANNIIFSLFLLIISILAYVAFKTNIFGYTSELPYLNTLENVMIFLMVLAITYLFIKLTSKLITRYLEQRGRNKKNIRLLLKVYKYFIWVLVIFITLSLLFKQIGSLITSLGLIGFGVTLALQKPILNFVGWITIIFSKTYQIEDVISINNLNGKVYDIKVMYTSLSELTEEGDSTGRSVSIPNEFVLTTPVINYTKGTNLVWDTVHIYLTYQSKWKKALEIIEKTSQDFYEKNIRNEVRKILTESFKSYEKVVVRLAIYEKGIHIKIRYLVDFDKSNALRTELSKILLDKLRVKGIVLGKVEDIKGDAAKYL